MIFFTVLGTRPVVHEILVGIFVTVTTPVTLMLLARAALHRDRAEGNPQVPAEAPGRAAGGRGTACPGGMIPAQFFGKFL